MHLRLCLCLLATFALLRGSEGITVTFTPTDAGGEYGPLYVQAAWVETPAGDFVKTIGQWRNDRWARLYRWASVTGAATKTADIDGLMGATINGYATPTSLSSTWNMTYKAGAVAPDGSYKIWFETVNADVPRPVTSPASRLGCNMFSLTVPKDGIPRPTPQSVTDPSGRFLNVSWTYTGRAPVIAAEGQPAAQSVVVGSTATFDVIAGGGSLSYQWNRGGVPIAGATASSYTTPATVLGDSGALFTCTVRNGDGGATSGGTTLSAGATLTVTAASAAPSIVTAPSAASVSEGQPASFTVVAGGTAPLAYQWQKNGVDIVGATAAGYSIPATVRSTDNGAVYRCVVSGAGAPATSSGATLTVNRTPVAITAQTIRRTVDLGQGTSTTFNVVAVGTPPLAYQWKKGGVNIAGATSPSYTKTGIVLGDNGSTYTCAVTGVDAAGAVLTVTSAAIPLTVGIAPAITTQPLNRTVAAGGTTTLSVVASGTTPGYPWYRNGIFVGAGATYTIPATDTQVSCNGDTYYCLVSNQYGEVSTAVVTLTVTGSVPAGTAPTITKQPANATSEGVGWQSKFFVIANGSAPLSYQWRKNGTNIAGANSDAYITPPTAAADANATYSCVVSNAFGSVTSANATLKQQNPPNYTTQPATPQSKLAGQTATFTVAVVGTPNLLYKWYKNGVVIASATAASYTTPALTAADDGARYYCIAYNSDPAKTNANYADSYSIEAVLSVLAITGQPQAQTVTAGQTASFSVTATGSGLSYQWRKNGVNIGGATSASYTTPATVTGDSGSSFTCVVSNSAGSVTSSGATLTVNSSAVAPSITTQPSSATKTEGQTATFSVTASGTAPLTYQWRKNGVDIGGATSASYTTPATVLADSGASFTCVVTNGVGSATSNAAVLTVNPAPPVITTQPSAQTVNVGQTATFSVAATGSAPLSYQWKKNGANIAGATASSYTTPAATLADDGASYVCVVSNAAGTVTSSTAVLSVQAPPVITVNPVDQTVAAGATATFTVTATGSPTLYYQWNRNGSPIVGGTAASYTTPATTVAYDGSVYTCDVSNTYGSATSSGATLTVQAPPVITAQPVSTAVTAPATATFTITATGSATLTYQWRKNGTNIGGATATSYTTPATAFADDGTVFTCVVTNGFGSATSSGATLTVNAAPSITAQPSAQTVAAGATATFSVTATGTATLAYQWRKNGTSIGGATAASYTTPATAFTDDGAVFTCVVTNPYGSVTSTGATLTVQAAPSITAQPVAQTVASGASASFSVTATGSPTLTYQWRKNGVNIGGATAASYTTPATAFVDDGAVFTCVVTNAFGSATSSGATLTVQATPAITTQPAAQTVDGGQTATFSVVATGSPTLTYQWRKNGVNIGGATAASYTTPATVLADSGAVFTCRITNPYGNVTSAGATLTVRVVPSITSQPTDQSVTVGQTATFTVAATGSPTLAYQWSKDGVAIGGATAASYTTPVTVLADDGAQFTCTVTNAYGSATSAAATLSVTAAIIAPAITTQPAARSVLEGQTATFSIVATGTAPLAYQWRLNGVAIVGATAATHTTPATVLADSGGLYSCDVSNAGGSASSGSAALTVSPAPPTISADPADQTVAAGATATFSVTASGSAPLAYQWRKNGTNIGGATASSYTTPATVFADQGASYACVVSNAAGSVTSAAAVLTVHAAPAITTPPASQSVSVGATASFSVVAVGTAPLSYQWNRNGAPIGGANAASYTTPATALGDDGDLFTCDVSNPYGSVTSAAAALTVTSAPVITGNPVDQTVASGATATFSVTASGSGLSYQWQRGGAAIAGATAASYTTAATVPGDDGAAFSCVVSNAYGSTTSLTATLRVTVAPSITTDPVAQTVQAGQTATFAVTAAGSAPLSYQWSRDGVAIAGATAASYTTPATSLGDDGSSFACTVTNPYGSAASGAGLLTVQPLVGGQAYVSFTPSSAGGLYAPDHVLAAWIETTTGSFVRTIGDWSGLRRTSLTQWRSKAGVGDTDAVMGATRSVMTPVGNLTWDLTAASDGLPVPDGTYRLWIELADNEIPPPGTTSITGARRTSVPFDISGGAVVPVGPLSQDGFASIAISPTPIAGPAPVITNTAGGITRGCGGGGIYGMLMPLLLFLCLRGQRFTRP
jgi:hypothetical protein